MLLFGAYRCRAWYYGGPNEPAEIAFKAAAWVVRSCHTAPRRGLSAKGFLIQQGAPKAERLLHPVGSDSRLAILKMVEEHTR